MAVICSANILYDGKCFPFSRILPAMLMPSYSCNRVFKSSILLERSPLCRPRRLCVAFSASSDNSRWNSDFSRQKRGTSKGKGRQFQDSEQTESSEETEFVSNNGPLLSLASNSRYQATATPGKREKEIVELFRKVQAQLRERASIKEEKKIEAAQQGQNERGTVDSLLNLLRKHSVDQKKNSSIDENFNLDRPDRNNTLEDEPNFDVLGPNKEIHVGVSPTTTRPASNFRKKSPVPRVKFQPVFSTGEDISSSSALSQGKGKGKKASKAELKVEAKEELALSDGIDEEAFDHSASSDAVEDNEISTEMGSDGDLSSLKLAELRELAKARGIKGYSKFKKGELVALLSGL